jgi:hypothetical protein
MNKITSEKLARYFEVTEKAFSVAKASGNRTNLESERADFLDMVSRYIADAKHFNSKDDIVNSFAALNYAHGWLDAGARIGIFDVHDSKLFTVDD